MHIPVPLPPAGFEHSEAAFWLSRFYRDYSRRYCAGLTPDLLSALCLMTQAFLYVCV